MEYKNSVEKTSYSIDNLEETKILCENISFNPGAVGMTSKMWILPNGKIVHTRGRMHFKWALENKKMLYDDFKIDIRDMEYDDGEEIVRKKLVSQGMFRVNYEQRNGGITIEGVKGRFNKKIKDSIFYMVLEHSEKIYQMTITLFNENISKVVANKSVQLFRYDDEEKINHIPFIS
jgi:hypothetical protein